MLQIQESVDSEASKFRGVRRVKIRRNDEKCCTTQEINFLRRQLVLFEFEGPGEKIHNRFTAGFIFI